MEFQMGDDLGRLVRVRGGQMQLPTGFGTENEEKSGQAEAPPDQTAWSLSLLLQTIGPMEGHEPLISP